MPPIPGNFASRVKGAVRRNFNESANIYRAFEEKTGFFRLLTLQLAAWMEVRKGAIILDIGCGNGASCQVLRETYDATVFGVDLSEVMISDAHRHIGDSRIHLIVGDGEALAFGHRSFDTAMYNASLFVFPHPEKSLAQAKALLRPGGTLGFSFYPRVYGPGCPDLIEWAYNRQRIPPPKFRTITPWKKACNALESLFEKIQTTTYVKEGNIPFLIDFFSIPAQSASLFPGLPYEKRAARVQGLFETLKEWDAPFSIGWDMAKAKKVGA